MIPDEAVEAAGTAVYHERLRNPSREWTHDEMRAAAERSARAALEAAGPLMLAEAWDSGFTASARQHQKQREDPTHAIERNNPHRDRI